MDTSDYFRDSASTCCLEHDVFETINNKERVFCTIWSTKDGRQKKHVKPSCIRKSSFKAKKSKNDKINDKINKLDQAILSEIRKNKYVTITELADKTGRAQPTIYRHIERLVNMNVVKRMGSRKSGYWEIIDDNKMG